MGELADFLRDNFEQLDAAAALDIFIIWISLFWILLLLRNTTAMTVIRGATVLLIAAFILGRVFDLRVLNFLLRNSFLGLLFGLIVIFSAEIRRALERIGRTTSHEVAHMWFYGLVVNDQGRDPWMDEGLATWAEGRYEGTTGSLMGTAIPAGGQGRTGQPMSYWEARQSIYYRSVYVQGAQAIGALGPPDQVDCALRHYVARAAYRVADPDDLIDAFALVFPDAEATLARYGIHRRAS